MLVTEGTDGHIYTVLCCRKQYSYSSIELYTYRAGFPPECKKAHLNVALGSVYYFTLFYNRR